MNETIITTMIVRFIQHLKATFRDAVPLAVEITDISIVTIKD